ncbi:hypothetical protein CVT26_001969 [Gymnopilus dilepis]|uniref:Rad51-like C-terminal domain-containing protein n=1 Tax=Gymnopilus dilepis TaxID=231916 RepID=A0A409VC04_9AGAR|nr:hypothetical protein CVT26_001969 [Gymnopilus dilepis]
MRLSSLVPTISSNLVAALETRGIRTEADLLYKASAFEIYKLLPAKTVTLQELIDCIEIVAGVSAASGFSGTQLYHAEEATRSKDADFRSGHVDLDSFLKGLNGQVIEISGDRSSGKSTLALNLVLRSIAFSDTSAVWIDTTGEFSAVKASTILAQAKIPDSVLERIQVSFAFDIGMAQEVLQELYQLNDLSLRFIVLDCITLLLGPLLSSVSAHGHAIMTEFMQQLRTFSLNSGVTIMVINNTASKGPGTSERKPALGPSFVSMTDTTLWLQVHQDSDQGAFLHSIQVLKSCSKVGSSPPAG